jgi:hypothetical protein
MDLTSDQQQRLSFVCKTVAYWRDQQHPSEVQKQIRAAFNEDINKKWLNDTYAPSLLEGEKGVERILFTLESEINLARLTMKTIVAVDGWDSLAAPPDQASMDLKQQGWEVVHVQEYLAQRWQYVLQPQELETSVALDDMPMH